MEKKKISEHRRKMMGKYQKKYQQTSIKRYALAFNRNTESDVIKKLDSIENKKGYIKDLIRKDIAK